jgi:hypothetical protein
MGRKRMTNFTDSEREWISLTDYIDAMYDCRIEEAKRVFKHYRGDYNE